MPNLTTSTDVDTFMGSANQAAMRTNMGLGTAATEDSTAFATAAQGGLADSAVQPGDLGSAAYQDSTAFATAAQGGLADSAVQPGDLGSAAYEDATAFATAAQGGLADSAVQPGDLGTAAYADTGDFATAAQGVLADSALQPAEIKSADFTAANNGFYITTATCTATDPSPSEGANYYVLVRNGTTTIGGTGYATAGVLIRRVYHSGAWASYVDALQGAVTSSGLTMGTGKVLARTTASTGAIEEKTVSELLDTLGSAAQGAIAYRGASGWALLPAGTNGEALLTLGAGVDPQWGNPSVGTVFWPDIEYRPQTRALTSNVTSTNTSYADVTGLTITVDVPGTYSFEVTGVFTSSVTTEGIKLAMNGPTSSFIFLSVAFGATTTYVNSLSTYAAWDDGPTIPTTGGSTPREFRIAGVFTATDTGTLAVRFAAETGGANSATVNAGTFFTMTPAD